MEFFYYNNYYNYKICHLNYTFFSGFLSPTSCLIPYPLKKSEIVSGNMSSLFVTRQLITLSNKVFLLFQHQLLLQPSRTTRFVTRHMLANVQSSRICADVTSLLHHVSRIRLLPISNKTGRNEAIPPV